MDDNETYAKLLSSIQTNSIRPSSPIQVARLIERLINEEGREAAESLLPIDKDMIGYFLRLKNKLPKECHNAILWGTTNSLGVGFTAAHHVATLETDEDKKKLFSLCFQNKIPKEDIKKIISEFKRTKQPFEEVMAKYYSSVRKITTYMIVLAISDYSKKVLKAKSVEENKSEEEIFYNCLKEKYGVEGKDFKIQGNNLAFSLSESDYESYEKGTPANTVYSEIIAFIVGG